jgi:hypothetical protein
MDPTTREQLREVLNKLPNTGDYAPIRRKIVTMIKLAKKVEKLEKEADKVRRLRFARADGTEIFCVLPMFFDLFRSFRFCAWCAAQAEREADAAQRLLEATRAEVRQKEAELADIEQQPESSAMAAERERSRPRRRNAKGSEC